MEAVTPGIESLKARLKDTWMDGDYGRVAKSIESCADEFIGRLAIKTGTRLLDVACGSGNVALAAARGRATVTGVDIAPNLLEQARARAAAEGLTVQFDEGDAEQLPYADASFDVVVSMFGAMFAPRPEVAARELVRVCRPGGRIAMANWTPDGFAGQMFKTVSKHVPPPPGVPPPGQWGDEAIVRQRLRSGVADLRMAERICVIRYPFAPGEVVEFFRTYFGPVRSAFGALDADGQAALRRDLEQVWSAHNRAGGDGLTEVHAGYLEVIATRG
ncbi:MAG TPA: methyltransferase domain-containing protein [Lacipirellulaceae bacterium]|nr:methyltransferase domain-containing protein [Lacipirellulaceae bacterium]